MAKLRITERQRSLLRSGLKRSEPDVFRRRAFELMLAPYLRDPNLATGITPFRISHRVREAVWRSLGEFDLSAKVAGLSLDALVMHGKHDPIPLSSSRHLATLLGARLVTFDESGHMPFVEEQKRFLALTEEFLFSADGAS